MRTEKQILNDFFIKRESEEKQIQDYQKIYKIMKKIIITEESFYKELLMKYIINL